MGIIMRRKKYLLMAFFTAALFFISVVLFISFNSFPALYVESIAIPKEEVEFFLSQEKSAVYAHFANEHNADTSIPIFAETKFNGVTPNEYARNRALQEIITSKNILLLSREYELTNSVSYSAIKKDWQNFVALRKESIANNGIVYGPVEMTFPDYYSYYISNLRLSLFEHYKEENPIQDRELQNFYKSHKELFRQGDTILLKVYIVTGGNDCDSEELLKQAKNDMESHGEIQPLTRANLKGFEENELTLSEMSNKGDTRSNMIYLEAITGLSEGEVSEVNYDGSIGYYMVQYLARKEGETIPYDEVKNRLTDMIMTDRFNAYLEGRKEELTVTVINSVYDNIK